MRIIFSRKGFDSGSGGVPSPIVEGHPITLPIPDGPQGPTRYRDLRAPLPRLVGDLSRGRVRPSHRCHLDPDLDPDALRGRTVAAADWRGSLGQVGAAQGHLRNQGVGPDDLFLFFGLFRAAARHRGKWTFSGTAQHCLFGWLQVAEVIALGEDGRWLAEERPWLEHHPHLRGGWGRNNTLYLARSSLGLGAKTLPGSGLLDTPIPLTAKDAERVSAWQLPAWVDPTMGGVGLSYHGPHRWQGDGRLSVVSRGQEFVADIGCRADAREWVIQMLEQHLELPLPQAPSAS